MKKISIKKALALTVWVVATVLMFVACEDELDVKQAYSYDLVTMPVQKQIIAGQTAEIRCTLVKEGDYSGVSFTIRYFQPDGKGELRMDDGMLFEPNDRYALDRTGFRLYYTSHSTDQQTIDVYIEDNFGQCVSKSFSFSNESTSGEEETEQ
jgi:hypothetical protein